MFKGKVYARTHVKRARTRINFIIILTFLLSIVYKMKIFYIFLPKYLHMSKKSSTFAPELINNTFNNKILTL